MKKAAVILCGSGFKDGSEVRESVAVIWALAKQKVQVEFFASDEPQADVVNCQTGQSVAGETRNQLVESARISRGKSRPLKDLRASDFQMILLPGGFGAAKNLCTFATQGAKGKVQSDLERVLKEFKNQNKPIGAVCIAPAILALCFAGTPLELTLGAPGEAAAEIEKLGHRHVAKKASEWHVDGRNKVVTSPAYMHDDAPLDEIFQGIDGLVAEVCRMA